MTDVDSVLDSGQKLLQWMIAASSEATPCTVMLDALIVSALGKLARLLHSY
jgi:hypothetical protein